MVLWPLPQPSTLKVASSILAKCKCVQKHYQISVINSMKRKVIRPRYTRFAGTSQIIAS